MRRKKKRLGADRTAPATGATSRRHWTPSCITQRLLKRPAFFFTCFTFSNHLINKQQLEKNKNKNKYKKNWKYNNNNNNNSNSNNNSSATAKK